MQPLRFRLPVALLTAGFLACVPLVSYGVVVSGGDGTQNTTAPADDFGFSNVGLVFDSADGFYTSGIYLGDGWMLSAYHEVRNGSGGFAFGNVLLAGSSFSVAASSAVRVTNADNTPADLALYRLTTVPAGLSGVTISAAVPVENTPVMMAGNGINRQAGLTQWNVNTGTDPWTWTETGSGGDASGYKPGSGQALRWGSNNLTSFGGSLTTAADDGFGITTFVKTTFDSGLTNEGQAAIGDSGGGLFYKNGTQWELLGVLLAVNGYSGQPGYTSVYGDETWAAALPDYRSQILDVIPEPATAGLFAGGLLLLASRRRFLRR